MAESAADKLFDYPYRRLAKLLAGIEPGMSPILTHVGDDEENRCRNQEHEAIVEALINRDRRKAVRIMNQHLLHIEGKIGDEPQTAQTDIASLLGPIQREQPA